MNNNLPTLKPEYPTINGDTVEGYIVRDGKKLLEGKPFTEAEHAIMDAQTECFTVINEQPMRTIVAIYLKL